MLSSCIISLVETKKGEKPIFLIEEVSWELVRLKRSEVVGMDSHGQRRGGRLQL